MALPVAGRCPSTVLAADGKRLRGINRHADGGIDFETVTRVTHDGHPLTRRCGHDEGGELAATKALLEDVAVRGSVITLDALHTPYDTEPVIVEVHRADSLFTVKGNAPETDALLKSLDGSAPDVRHYHAPANNATLNNLVLAIIFHRGFRPVPKAQRHFMRHRQDALDALLCAT